MSDYLCQMSQSAALNRALTQIDLMLHKHGKNTEPFGLPTVDHPDDEYHRLLSAFDRDERRLQPQTLIPRLNEEQRRVHQQVTTSVLTNRGGAFMIDAPAGSGKTFTMTTIAADLRSRGKLVLCSAQQQSQLYYYLVGLQLIPPSKFLLATSSCRTPSATSRQNLNVLRSCVKLISSYGTKFQ